VDLETARLQLQLAGERLGLTDRTRWLPDLELGVAAEREPVDGTWSVGPSIALPLPLLNQGQGATAAAARAAATAVLAARSRARHVREVLVPLRHQITEETQLQCNAMQVGAFQLLTAKREEIAAGRLYVESLRDYWQLRAEFEQILAGQRPRAAATAWNGDPR
jgi:cobalt-zinc-cadmium efflux system outer membrane protein